MNNDNEPINVIGNYMESNHNASRIVDPSSIAPTVMENHGTVTGVPIPISLSRGQIEESSIAHCLSAEGPAKEGVNTHQAMNRVAIPIMNPSIINKQQHGRRFKEDEEPMFTLTAQDVHGVGIGVNQIGRRLDTARDNPQRNRVYDPNGLSPSLNGIGNGGNLEPQIPVCVAGFGEKKSNGGSQYYQQDRVYDGTKVATTLSHQLPGGSNYYSIPLETDEDNTMKEEIPKIIDITIADPEDTKEHPDIYVEFSTGLKVYAIWYEKYNCYITIRKLTPKECFRLQGFPDYLYERAAFVNSDSQLYRQSGNAITTNIAYEIGKKLTKL